MHPIVKKIGWRGPREGRVRSVLCIVLAVALASAAWAARGGQARAGGSAEWLLDATAQSLSKSNPSNADIACEALAIRSLLSASLRVELSRIDVLRERLGGLQHTDGSFGSGDDSSAVTWLVLGALDDSVRGTDVQRAARAREWLSSSRSAGASPGLLATNASPPIQRAFGFLHGTNASAENAGDHFPSGLATLAGGRFDLRAAYAAALAGGGGEPSIANAVPAGKLFAAPLYDLLLNVAVLDHYRTSNEAALLAELTRPLAPIMNLLASLRGSDAVWSDVAGGAPRIDATACAFMIRETVYRWNATWQSRSGEGDPADVRNPASREKQALGCESCHATLQPLQVEQWRASAHAGKQVGCADCHGTNHSTIFREGGKVAPTICARCHDQAAAQFENSKHAHAEETLFASALFASTPPAARAACVSCHRIGERQSDGSHGNCNYCHVAHTFDAREAKRPEACTVCHTGADYPQDLAYRLSKHGALQLVAQDKRFAPTCASCHQPAGRHDDGFGLTLGASGAGAVFAGTPSAFRTRELSADDFARRRAEMVAICTQCHSSRLAEASLREADELKREGDAQLLEAANLLRALQNEGYFGAGVELGLGPEYARPDPSRPGAELLDRFYRMWRFEHASAWKGAYHQSASIANRSSGAGTQDDLQFMRAQAQRWRARGKERGTQR